MHKKYILSIIIIIHTLLYSGLKAQVKNSIYSMFGVGQITDNSFGINKSLGGAGIAFQSGSSINFINPASYIGIPKNTYILELGIYGIYNKSKKENLFQSSKDINFSYLAAGLYFSKWWASSIGIVPFSTVDYEISSSDQIGGELTTYKKIFQGSGGLNRIYWGNSFLIYKGLTIGFNTSYIFGPITQKETAVSNENFDGYELKNTRTAHTLYFDCGLQYSYNINDLLYTIGFVYGNSTKLDLTDNVEFTYNGTNDTFNEDEKLDIKIPQKFGLGIAVKKENYFRADFDYEWESWSNIKFSNPNIDTKNSSRFSIGAEYSPRKENNDISWLNYLTYRIGANYKNSYLEIDKKPINSFGIDFGIGIPFDINLSLEYGEEGTLNKGLIKNNYWIIYMNISLQELWSSTPHY